MPPDLSQLLHQAAPEPSRPLDPEHVCRAGRRRRQGRRFTVGLAIVAFAGLVAVAMAWLDRPEPNSTLAAGGGIVAEDPTHGLTLEYPPTWHRSTALTPALADPVEILSLGTGDLPSGGHSCAQFPVATLEAMSPTDAFVTVQERLSTEAAGLRPGQPWDEAAGFPPRPEQFPPRSSKNVSEVPDCLAAPPVFDHWWFAFNDAGRAFHVLVAIGTQASNQIRAETWAILDSLRFERR
jgi:hypothetical protein